MSLNILPAPTPVQFEDDASRAITGTVGSRTAWLAFDILTPPDIPAQSYLLEALSNHLRVYISASAGPGFRISHSHEPDAGGTAVGSTVFNSGTGFLGARTRCIVEFDEVAGETRYTMKSGATTVTHTEPVPLDHSIRMSFFTVRATGSAASEIQWYSICENIAGVIPLAEKDAYLLDGTIPPSASRVQEPSGSGFASSIAPTVGLANFVFTNPVVGDTDAGSPNAPYLTVSGSASETGWQSVEIRKADGAAIAQGTLITAAVYDDTNVNILVAQADYAADATGRIRIADAGIGAVGTPIKIRIYLGAENFTASGAVANV